MASCDYIADSACFSLPSLMFLAPSGVTGTGVAAIPNPGTTTTAGKASSIIPSLFG